MPADLEELANNSFGKRFVFIGDINKRLSVCGGVPCVHACRHYTVLMFESIN
jgi:hypothetical protein